MDQLPPDAPEWLLSWAQSLQRELRELRAAVEKIPVCRFPGAAIKQQHEIGAFEHAIRCDACRGYHSGALY